MQFPSASAFTQVPCHCHIIDEFTPTSTAAYQTIPTTIMLHTITGITLLSPTSYSQILPDCTFTQVKHFCHAVRPDTADNQNVHLALQEQEMQAYIIRYVTNTYLTDCNNVLVLPSLSKTVGTTGVQQYAMLQDITEV